MSADVKIPPYLVRFPDCPLCNNECSHDGEHVCCEDCEVYWPGDGRPGVRVNEHDTEPCGHEWQPYADQSKYPDLVGFTYRCVLDEGHVDDRGQPTDHAGPRIDVPWGQDDVAQLPRVEKAPAVVTAQPVGGVL